MKILIGCPTCDRYDYCIDFWLDRVKEIIEFSREKGIDVDYLLIDNSKTDDFFKKMNEKGVNIVKSPYFEEVRERIVFSRNILREKIINESYDFFFSLEQDVIPKKDIIEKLIFSDKNIISAYYSKLAELKIQDAETMEIKDITIEIPMVWLSEGENLKRISPAEILNRNLLEVGATGLGCMLISKEILEKISFRFVKGMPAFDDVLFCTDSRKQGNKIFLNSDIKVEHFHKAW